MSIIDSVNERIDKFTFYIFFLSSWAFLTIANFEWGSVTGRSEYGASFVPWSINVHSLRNPRLCRSAPLANRTFKTLSFRIYFKIAYICFMVLNRKISGSIFPYLKRPFATRIFGPWVCCHERPFCEAIVGVFVIRSRWKYHRPSTHWRPSIRKITM